MGALGSELVEVAFELALHELDSPVKNVHQWRIESIRGIKEVDIEVLHEIGVSSSHLVAYFSETRDFSQVLLSGLLLFFSRFSHVSSQHFVLLLHSSECFSALLESLEVALPPG